MRYAPDGVPNRLSDSISYIEPYFEPIQQSHLEPIYQPNDCANERHV